MDVRELFEVAGNCGIEAVNSVLDHAADNAALTVGESRFDAHGNRTDEFMAIWIAGVQCLLAAPDADLAAVEWFAKQGVRG